MPLYNSIDDLPERHQEFVADCLSDEEEFIKGTSVLYGDIQRYWPRLIVTDKRLWWCYNTLMHENTKSWAYRHITDIEGQRGLSFTIEIATVSGNTESFSLHADDGPEFYGALNDAYLDALMDRKSEVNR